MQEKMSKCKRCLEKRFGLNNKNFCIYCEKEINNKESRGTEVKILPENIDIRYNKGIEFKSK